jgi:hypothetical protein
MTNAASVRIETVGGQNYAPLCGHLFTYLALSYTRLATEYPLRPHHQ